MPTSQPELTRSERLLHEAHLRYQRQQLAPDATGMPSAEIRGAKRKPSPREAATYAQVYHPHWFAASRNPRIWTAFVQSQMWYARNLTQK